MRNQKAELAHTKQRRDRRDSALAAILFFQPTPTSSSFFNLLERLLYVSRIVALLQGSPPVSSSIHVYY